MKPLRIILALHESPLPFGGPAARWYHVLLRGLVARGHRVTAIIPTHDETENAEVRSLFPSAHYDIRCHPMVERGGTTLRKLRTLRRPFISMYGRSYRADLAAVLAEGCDILHGEQLWSGWLGLGHRDRCVVNVHYLFSIDWSKASGGSLSERLLRLATFRAERVLLRRLQNIITLTPRVTEAVKKINPAARVVTVPMALDLSLYPFDTAGPQGRAGVRPPTLALIGSFNWTPSQGAGSRLISRLWPAILQRVPEARLQIVGRNARAAFAHLPPPPRTEFHSDVPNTFPYFEATDVMLYAPEVGSGMKVKIMEAFALGTPVVTNSEGVEGLAAIDGVHAGIANEDGGLVERTVRLLLEAQVRQRQRIAARGLLESSCAPDAVIDRLLDAYGTLFPFLGQA